MAGNPLKRGVVRLLKNRPLGVPTAVVCRMLGARGLSRKVSRECGFVPAVVDVEVPATLAGGAGFSMHSGGGRDQVAKVMWLYGWDAFEKPMPDLFGACSRAARCIFDVGSYSGFYSHVGATCNKEAEVFAFEPYPAAREWLTRNIALNGLSGRVHVVPAAVSDRAGEADFYVPPNENGWVETSSSLDGGVLGTHEQVIKVDVTTLDLFRYSGGGRGPVGVMKVDVETLEHRVLAGGRRILAEDRPIVFVEVFPDSKTCPELDAIREEAGYVDGLLHVDGIDWRDRVEGVDQGRPYENNHVLCPAEKQGQLEEMARSLGYRISRMEFRGPQARA